MDEDKDYQRYYQAGYEYGFTREPSLVICYTDANETAYYDGVLAGDLDRQEVQRSGSSNT